MDIKTKRLELGLTQFDLARMVGVSLSTIRLWEAHVSNPNEENAERLNKALSVKEGGE